MTQYDINTKNDCLSWVTYDFIFALTPQTITFQQALNEKIRGITRLTMLGINIHLTLLEIAHPCSNDGFS